MRFAVHLPAVLDSANTACSADRFMLAFGPISRYVSIALLFHLGDFVVNTSRIRQLPVAFSIAFAATACGAGSVESGSGASLSTLATSTTTTAASTTTTVLTKSSTSTTSSTSTSSSAADVAPNIQDAWTDADGYAYQFQLTEEPVVSAEVDIANSKPGEAVLNVTMNASGLFTNATPGRNAEIPYRGVRAYAAYPAGSPACEVLGDLYIDAQPGAAVADPNLAANQGKFCAVGPLSFAQQLQPATIPAGGSWVVKGSSPFTPTGGVAVEYNVEETLAEPAATAIATPAGWVLSRVDGSGLDGLSDCLLINGYIPTAATIPLPCGG